MTVLPVVTREMSVLARRHSTYWARSATAVIAVLTMVWLLLISSTQISFGQLGTSIFFVLSSFCFVFALLIGMQATSDCVSEEKREGTLGLLFLTDLRAFDIIMGKMAASSCNAFFAVLGVVPMLSLALLLGGVTLFQVVLTALVLLNSMFLSLSLGVLVSTMSKNERKAMFACFVGLFTISVLPFVLSAALSEFEKVFPQLVFVSPIYSFLAAQASPAAGLDTSFLPLALCFQHALAWTFLGVASRILPRCIDELSPQRFQRLRQVIDNYVFGRREHRALYRAELLDRNPFLWLASRERIKPRYAWGVVAFFGLLFLWVRLQFPDILSDPPVPLGIIVLVHFTLKIWTASEVCSRLLADRRSGALELLLSSPLSVPEIARGQDLALRRIFRKPALALTIAECFVLYITLRSGRERPEALDCFLLYGSVIGTLWLDLWALKWVGLWLCLFGKSIERVLVATIARVMGVPAALFVLIAGTSTAIWALQNGPVAPTSLYMVWLVINLLSGLGFGLSARRKFLRHFREAAAQTFSPRSSAPEIRSAGRTGGGSILWTKLTEHWVISTAGAVLLVLTLLTFGQNAYWTSKVRSEVSAIKAAHQPASAVEIGMVYPQLAAGENAFGFLQRSGMIGWKKWLPSGYAYQLLINYRNSREKCLLEVRSALAGNLPQLDAARQIRGFSKAYLPPESLDSWRLPVDLPGYCALLVCDFLDALEVHETPRALDALDALLHLAVLSRDQPLHQLQRVSFEILAAFGSGLELALSRNLLSTDDLYRFQRNLETLLKLEPLAKTLSVERARQIDRWALPSNGALAQSGIISRHLVLSSNQQQLHEVLLAYRKVMGHLPGPHSRILQTCSHPGASPGNPLTRYWSNSDTPGPLAMVALDASVQARLELLHTALAAEIYRSKEGKYPSQLRHLVPEFLDGVPRDPVSDDPLDYTTHNGSIKISVPHNPLPNRLMGSITMEINHLDLRNPP